MDKQKVLVPYNFTNYDEKALDFVTRRFADDKGVEVTLFNAYTPVPKIALRNSLIMQKISSNLAYLQQKINEHETGIKQAREKLIQNGFSSNRVHYIFRALNKDVAQDIVDLVLDKAKEEEIRAIVSLPITLKGKIVGALRLYGSEVWDITKRDIEHLQVVAQNIGVAMD